MNAPAVRARMRQHALMALMGTRALVWPAIQECIVKLVCNLSLRYYKIVDPFDYCKMDRINMAQSYGHMDL